MPLFYSKTTFDIASFDWSVIEKWRAEGDPRAEDYVQIPSAPEFNPATHNPPKFVNGVFVPQPKTADELAAIAAAAADAEETRQLKLVVAALKAGTGTAGERITRLERVCVHLIKTLFA